MRHAVLATLVIAAMATGTSDAAFTAATLSPANVLATGRGTWFSGNATGTSLCAGTNALLACPFGTQPAIGRASATATLQNKDIATTYTLAVVDGTGPVGISTFATAAFASTRSASVTLAPGAADTITLTLKFVGKTPAGSYTGFFVITDSTSGASVAIPISVTH